MRQNKKRRRMARRLENDRNHIAIFQNKYKKKPNQPDWIGTYVDKDGVEHDVALWKLTSNNNKKTYFAGRVNNREEARKKYGNKSGNNDAQSDDADWLDDIPF
jgi:hypothetical protein